VRPTPPTSPTLSPWEQQLADAEHAWHTLHNAKPGDRLALSATFVGFDTRSPLPSELRLRLRLSTINLKGPFPRPATDFIRQLKTDDRLDLEVEVGDASRFPRGVTLNWIARAGASATEQVPGRPASQVSLVRTIAVSSNGPINSISWSPDGSNLAVAARPATLWDATTGTMLAVLDDRECVHATWSSDGRQIALVEGSLAGASMDRIVICDPAGKVSNAWPTQASRGLLVASNPVQPQMAVVARNPSGGQMAVGLVNFASKPASQALGEFIGTPRVAWNSEGTRLSLAARDSSFRGIRISKLNARNLLTKVEDVGFEGLVSDVRWVPKSELLAVLASNDLTVADPLDKDRAPLKIENVFGIRKYAFSSDGRLVAAIRVTGNVQVWGVEAAATPQWDDDTTRFDSVAWSPTRPLLAALESSGGIQLWNASGLRLARIARGATSTSGDQEIVPAFSPDGNRLAAINHNTVLIYDVSQAESDF
jgi:WD40 repeat protein